MIEGSGRNSILGLGLQFSVEIEVENAYFPVFIFLSFFIIIILPFLLLFFTHFSHP